MSRFYEVPGDGEPVCTAVRRVRGRLIADLRGQAASLRRYREWAMSNRSSAPGASGADLYAVLGVSPEADLKTIRSAYRRQARDSHPDRGGSAEEFHRVQAAWEVLRSEAARAAYDRTRTDGRAQHSAGPDDVDAVRYGPARTWAAPAARRGGGSERGAQRSASGNAHLPPEYRPDLSDSRPLSLSLTSQRVHGEFRSQGLFSRGRIQRRHARTIEVLQRHVLDELPAARLFNDVLLEPQAGGHRRERTGRRRGSSGDRAEHVLVCGDMLTVIFSLEVPTPAASWDGQVLRAAGRGLALPDLAAQARQLRETLMQRLLDERGHEVLLTVDHQVILHSPDGGLLSPVVETTRGGGSPPLAVARAARRIVGQLAASSQANVVDRHLLAILRDQLSSPEEGS
ncbi:DnaJ domain-containing protein [Nesterenkonia xinjiangensis]|uniref:Curved DNA-binding protein CbpA n=1 Tax=Nesterenkonia xinjiangensis TaxID=225327 RepID=A0A7Z0GMW5_9MICC|nr:curved DNA-binding protein CbpA [Nesterenkonia xinjiangensis]